MALLPSGVVTVCALEKRVEWIAFGAIDDTKGVVSATKTGV
jgi:hypothetical protein